MANVIRDAWGVLFQSNKNNILNRKAQQSKILDDVVLDKVLGAIKASVSRGTGRSRSVIDRMKTVIISGNKQINSKAATLSQAIKVDGSVEQNIINLVNRGVFFVLSPDGTKDSAGSTKQREFKKLLQEGTKLLGTRENSPLTRILKAAGIPTEYKELINEDDSELESEDNKFFQLVSDKPLSRAEAEKLASDFLTNYVNAWDGENTIFGTLRPIAYYLEMNEITRKATLNTGNTAYVFIRHETGSYSEYHHLSMKVIINEVGGVESATVKTSKRGFEFGARVEVQKVDYESMDRSTTRAILEADRVYKTEGVSVLEYGHLISAGYALLLETLADLDVFIESIDANSTSNQIVNKLHNLRTTLYSIVAVAKKLDGIIESWGNTMGPDVMGLTHADILAVLGSAESFDPGEIYVYEKVGGIIARKETISRKATFTVTLEDGTLETREGPLVGVMERARFNNAKGKITAALINILKKELEGSLEKALSVEDIQNRLGVTGLNSSASDSVITATIRYIFGMKIDKGSGYSAKIKLGKGEKVKLGKSPATTLAKVKSPTGGIVNTKKKPSSVPAPTNNTNNSPLLTSSTTLASRINKVLQQELINDMKAPSLVNRTGRFAGSAEVLDVSNSIVTYKYMYYPYSVFSKATGRAPWNSVPERDPDNLIVTIANRLLASYTPGVAYTYKRG